MYDTQGKRERYAQAYGRRGGRGINRRRGERVENGVLIDFC